jgi:aspartate kinase
MIVMKFGGSSLQNAVCIRRAVDIVMQHQSRQPLVVVSAIGRTTQALVHLGRTALADGPNGAAPLLEELLHHHRALLGDLEVTPDMAAEAERGIARLGQNIAGLLEGVSLLQELTPRTQDAILGHGERFSTLLFAAAAGHAGLDAVRIDATKVIITDDRFRAARPDRDEIRARAQATVQPLIEGHRIPVIEGFIGATPEGAPTTMGFEASDYTASLLGAALDAEEIQIWTDVRGILTTGCAEIENVLSIRELSFEEAAELSFFGAKVLHPRTIDPAADRNIPVRILHSRHPEGAGTRIFGAPPQADGAVKSIALIEDAILVRSRSQRPVAVHRTIGFIGATLDRHEVSPHLIAVSGHRVVFAVAGESKLETVLGELAETLEVSREEGCVIVSLVGADAGNTLSVAARATETMGEIPVLLMSYGASDTSVSLVVSEKNVPEVVVKLHREFFGDGIPEGVFARADEEVRS